MRELEVDEGGSATSLELSFKPGSREPWGLPQRASRQARVSARIDFDAFEGEDFITAGLDYDQVNLHKLRERGWFVPGHLGPGRFRGLQVLRHTDCAEPFELKPTVPSGSTFVASYVGDERGQLAPGLEQAEDLLDCNFDGLCCHTLPHVELPREARGIRKARAVKEDVAKPLKIPRQETKLAAGSRTVLGVVLGPSGSGKSTLVRHQLGRPLRPAWNEGRVVLEHFADLALAEKVLFAAYLPLEAAMAPYAQLSRGEQSRADLARVLAYGAARPPDDMVELVVEEFTSLVDRATARVLAGCL